MVKRFDELCWLKLVGSRGGFAQITCVVNSSLAKPTLTAIGEKIMPHTIYYLPAT